LPPQHSGKTQTCGGFGGGKGVLGGGLYEDYFKEPIIIINSGFGVRVL